MISESRVDFLGCPVDGLSMEQAVGKVEDFIRRGTPHHVAVINANKLWLMERDSRVTMTMQGAALVLPEKAVVIGGRILGVDTLHHVGGIMLLKAFLDRAQEKEYRVFFLGAKPEILVQMIQVLAQSHPRLKIAGSQDGYFKDEELSSVKQRVRTARPDVLFVAMGTPKQEYWITEHMVDLGVPVCMGVGGSFDVIAGRKKDAPAWVRTLAMEWLYRLAQDPKNLWKRYLITIPWFLRKVLRARFEKSLSHLNYGRG
jgi:N-acetylglucosaminyldiphosphoundecaprenol N-acetyl-beta-D-mannosaminyltransferase